MDGELRYLAIECQKGRGIIMPGGKWETGEKYTESAIRELEEETGLKADPKHLEYVWMGPDGDGYLVMAFRLPYKHIRTQEPKETPEGKPMWVEEEDFQNSKYAGYYECLFQVINRRDR
jgi:8-oxo-dGTP pyrophosphatase MutT (NUDIX family)